MIPVIILWLNYGKLAMDDVTENHNRKIKDGGYFRKQLSHDRIASFIAILPIYDDVDYFPLRICFLFLTYSLLEYINSAIQICHSNLIIY